MIGVTWGAQSAHLSISPHLKWTANGRVATADESDFPSLKWARFHLLFFFFFFKLLQWFSHSNVRAHHPCAPHVPQKEVPLTPFYSKMHPCILALFLLPKMIVIGLKEIQQVLKKSFKSCWVVCCSDGNLMNWQAQSRTEPVSEPRANETAAFYTVRTKI